MATIELDRKHPLIEGLISLGSTFSELPMVLDEKGLAICGMNMNNTLMTAVMTSEFKSEVPIQCNIDIQELGSTLKAVKKGNITLNFEDDLLTIQAGSRKTKLRLMNMDGFQAPPEIPLDTSFEVNPEDIVSLVKEFKSVDYISTAAMDGAFTVMYSDAKKEIEDSIEVEVTGEALQGYMPAHMAACFSIPCDRVKVELGNGMPLQVTGTNGSVSFFMLTAPRENE